MKGAKNGSAYALAALAFSLLIPLPSLAQVVIGGDEPDVTVNWAVLDRLGNPPTLPDMLKAQPPRPSAASRYESKAEQTVIYRRAGKAAESVPAKHAHKPLNVQPAAQEVETPPAPAPKSAPAAKAPPVPAKEVTASIEAPPKPQPAKKAEAPQPPAPPPATVPAPATLPSAALPPPVQTPAPPAAKPTAPPPTIAQPQPPAIAPMPPITPTPSIPAPTMPAPLPPAPVAPPQVATAVAPPSTLPASKATSGSGVYHKGDVLTVLFTPDESRLPDAAQGELTALAQKLSRDESLSLQLVAFAQGDEASTSKARRLSLSRALEVRRVLMDLGVRSTRIEVRALGNKNDSGDSPDRVDAILTVH